MKLISVIIPVYNVSDYLECCIHSVTSQTYTNLEIILVDDGSTDTCGTICDRYQQRDKRIHVYHTQNSGLSRARNFGFLHATGEFVCFIDSDDYIADNYIELMYNNLTNTNSDICMCGYARVNDNNYFNTSHSLKNRLWSLTSSDMLSDWHGSLSAYETVAWNKLYRKELLDKFAPELFPVGKLHEDIYTSHCFVAKANQIVITNASLYAYRKRSGSITRSGFNYDKLLSDRTAQLARYSFFHNQAYDTACLNLIIGMLKHDIYYYFKCLGKENKRYRYELIKNLKADFLVFKALPGYTLQKPLHLSLYLAYQLICHRRNTKK